MRARGFTLIELVVVMALSGVMLTLAMPSLDVGGHRADSVAQLVRLQLQTAQRASLTRQFDVLVSFDTANRKIRIVWDADNDGAVTNGERVTWTSLQTGNKFSTPNIGVSGTVAASVVGTSIRTVDGYPTLTFHRDGSTSTDAEIYVTTASQKPALAFRAIRLIQATGKTDWYRQSSTGTWSMAKL